jgi:hypothetical protein
MLITNPYYKHPFYVYFYFKHSEMLGAVMI